MARTPVAFKEADVARAVKAARKAGVQVTRVEVDTKTGKIVIFSGVEKPEDDLDRELAEWARGRNDV